MFVKMILPTIYVHAPYYPTALCCDRKFEKVKRLMCLILTYFWCTFVANQSSPMIKQKLVLKFNTSAEVKDFGLDLISLSVSTFLVDRQNNFCPRQWNSWFPILLHACHLFYLWNVSHESVTDPIRSCFSMKTFANFEKKPLSLNFPLT